MGSTSRRQLPPRAARRRSRGRAQRGEQLVVHPVPQMLRRAVVGSSTQRSDRAAAYAVDGSYVGAGGRRRRCRPADPPGPGAAVAQGGAGLDAASVARVPRRDLGGLALLCWRTRRRAARPAGRARPSGDDNRYAVWATAAAGTSVATAAHRPERPRAHGAPTSRCSAAARRSSASRTAARTRSTGA